MQLKMKEHNGSTGSRLKRKRSTCQQNIESEDGDIKRSVSPCLPQDILSRIHSLIPMRDAARLACVSRAFLLFWRCHPNLTICARTLTLNKNAHGKNEIEKDFTAKVDHIMKNHIGIGVKTLDLHLGSFSDVTSCCLISHLDSWLQIAVKPGIEVLTLPLSPVNATYNVPCSLLSDGAGDSIQNLHLACCTFHPTVRLGCLRSLIKLQLYKVNVTGHELGSLLSDSCALKQLELRDCSEIVWLKLPCLQRLSFLIVIACTRLRMIEGKTPNLSRILFKGVVHTQLSLGEELQLGTLEWSCPNAIFHARTEFPLTMPNLETLVLYSNQEKVSTPMAASKFLHLKRLSIIFDGVAFDYLSLISFLNASPSLETLTLSLSISIHQERRGISVFKDRSDLRRMPKQRHRRLKRARITNFSSTKSVVELTCHIVESATALEHLTLDSTDGSPRCSINNPDSKCYPMPKERLVEAQTTVLAAETYIKPKVSSPVELQVLEPCRRCHSLGLYQSIDILSLLDPFQLADFCYQVNRVTCLFP